MAPNGSAWLAHVEQALEVPPDVPEPVGGLCLEALPDPIAHLRLRSGVPECVRGAAKSGHFCTVVQEPGAATAWVPTRVLRLGEEDGVDEMDQGIGWCVLRIGRPGSGKAGLKSPAPAGSSAAVCSILASERVAARLLSASGSEVLLVPQNLLPEAASALAAHGHAVWPATQVCEQAGSALPPSSPALARQLAGAWRLVQREEPLGTVVAEYTEGDGPVRLQVPSGHFVEVRVPVGDGGAHGVNIKEASFGGRCSVGEEGGHVLATQLRAVDFQPPSARPPRSQVLFGATSFEVVSHPGGDHRELWARLADAEGEFIALELEAEAPEPKHPRSGVWVFVGTRFARVLGPRRGSGLIANTCCRSLAQLQKLRGSADVRYELLEHYEAAFGMVEEPGLLRTQRAASRPEQAGKVFYSASDAATGEVVVDREQGTLLYTGPSGRRETWRIAEWTFDPFTPVAPPPAAGPASPSTSQTRAGASGEEEDEGQPTAAGAGAGAGAAQAAAAGSPVAVADSDAEDGPVAIRSLSRSLPNIGYLGDESALPIVMASPEQATPTQQAEVSPEAQAEGSPLPAAAQETEKRSRSRKKKRKKREAGDKDEDGAGAAPARSRSRKKKRKKREAAEADGKERRAREAEAEGEDAPAAPAAESPEPEKAAPAEPREDAAKRRKGRKDGAAEEAPRSRSRKRKKRKKREAAEKEEPPQEAAPQDEDDDHPPTPLASPEPAPASPVASPAAAPSPEPEREATPVPAPSEPAPARRRKGRKDGPAGAASRSKSRKKKRRKREAAAGSDEEPAAAPRPKEASPPPAPAKGRRRERSRSRSAERQRDRDRSAGARGGRNAGGGRARSEARRERDGGKRKKGRD